MKAERRGVSARNSANEGTSILEELQSLASILINRKRRLKFFQLRCVCDPEIVRETHEVEYQRKRSTAIAAASHWEVQCLDRQYQGRMKQVLVQLLAHRL